LPAFRKLKKPTSKNPFPSDGLETLHAIPLAYLLNGTTWHESPLGLSAKSILARFFFLQAEWAYLYDITRVCNQSGLTVSAFHSIPYASSLPFLSDSTSKMGVGILDLGGESGNGILYARGKPTVLFTLDVGGAFITSDLSIGFSVPLSEAEKMKRLWGSDTENQSEILEVVDLHGKTKVVTKEQALHILHPRLYEMASLIQEKIAPHKHLLGAGIILTGGGSRIKGFDKILHQILQMPCITLTAPGTSQLESKSLDSQDLACSAGMLILESRHKQQSEKNTTTPIGSLLYTEPTLEKSSLFSWFKKTAKS
jgi:cell division protein FtsA